MLRHGVLRRRIPSFALLRTCTALTCGALVAVAAGVVAFECQAASRSFRVLFSASRSLPRRRVACRAVSMLEDLTADKRPFLTFEENRPRRKRRLSRKERKQRNAEAEPLPLPIPAAEPAELSKQMQQIKNLPDLLKFLSVGVLSPGFGSDQAAFALSLLVQRKQQAFRGDGLVTLREDPAMALLIEKCADLFRSEETMPPAFASIALRSVATYVEHVPEMMTLVQPLAHHIVDRADDAKSEHVADIIWSIAELRDAMPELQNTVLPHFVDTDPRHRRIIGLRGRIAPHLIADVRNALFKLKRDVPDLREVLNVPERGSPKFSGIW